MIPVLYKENETEFAHNGLGKLADAITCEVTEERNGLYELEMTYPMNGVRFNDLLHSRIIKAVPADGKAAQPFRIYYISKPLNGIVKVKAEHISYQLSYIPVQPFTASSVTQSMAFFKTNAQEDCPFTFWTDKSTTGNFKVEIPCSIRSRLGGVEGSILDVYGGGEYEFDGYNVKLYQNRGSDKGVTLRYGKNITDIEQEENIANTYTGVYPYWQGTDDDNKDIVVTLDEKVLHSANAKNFPFQRTIPLDLSEKFENQPTKAQLKASAQTYMTANAIGTPSISINVSFIALWQTEEYKSIANLERVNLCDTVKVAFPKLDIEATSKVVKTVYDVLNERYSSIELGDARTNFGAKIQSDIEDGTQKAIKAAPSKSYLEKSIDRATKLITGGLGGHVVMGLNADDEPQEILVMDTDDVVTAVNVIRINKNGIGFSASGYDGPFRSAWTIDGHFVADFIDTGNLQAGLIKAGVLMDEAGTNFWNMETGEFRLASTITVDNAKTTLADYVSGPVDDLQDSLTQQKIFDILTKNGQTQGIYLSGGKLYINASYIATGTLADANNNTTFDLSTGALTMKKGSINIGNGNFVVTTGGALTAKNATLRGSIKAGSDTGWWMQLSTDGKLTGGYGSTTYGTIDCTGSYSNGNKGPYIKGDFISLSCSTLGISKTKGGTVYSGFTGNMKVVTKVDGSTVTTTSFPFINGILVAG